MMTPEQIDQLLSTLRDLVVATEKMNSNLYDLQFVMDDIAITLKRQYAYTVDKDKFLAPLKEAKH